MKRFIGFVRKEFFHIFRDVKSLSILFGMPIAQVLIFGFAITTEIKDVKIAWGNVRRDLLFLQIEEKLFPSIKLADIKSIKVGEKVYTLGSPLGLENSIDEGIFRPYTISAKVREAFQTHADEIGVPNPLDAAYDLISDIESQLSDASLDDLFPNIQNPLMPSIMDQGTIPGLNTGTPLNLPSVNPQALTNQGGNINYNQLTTQQKIDRLFGNI